MKKMNIKTFAILATTCFMLASLNVNAGNKDRVGQAGAYELLINPWAKSNGLSASNIANARGIEGSFLNVAGLAFTQKTQFVFSQTQYYKGSGINISAFGLSQRISETSVLGINVMSMSFGEMPITTVNQPEGGIGNFAPSYMNIGLSYAKSFSSSIHGGFNLKVINESVSDLTASGVAIDAGIQYVTGIGKDRSDNLRLGITLKNIGTPMSFSGDGISVRGLINGSTNNLTLEMRSGEFELPSLLAIGASYSFLWGKKDNVSSTSTDNKPTSKELTTDNAFHSLTLSATFIANSFTKDNFLFGAEYNYSKLFSLRAGYYYESGIVGSSDTRTTAFTGPSAGCSLKIPMSKDKGSSVSIDYAYRFTNPWGGCHTIGALIDL